MARNTHGSEAEEAMKPSLIFGALGLLALGTACSRKVEVSGIPLDPGETDRQYVSGRSTPATPEPTFVPVPVPVPAPAPATVQVAPTTTTPATPQVVLTPGGVALAPQPGTTLP